jgi:hypothetical protein
VRKAFTDLAVIILALAGGILLLKKGEEAGASRVSHLATESESAKQAPGMPSRPSVVWGRLDNFKEPISWQPVRSWGRELANAFMLTTSSEAKPDQPSTRMVIAQPLSRCVILEIQYTMPQEIVETVLADKALADKTDGVTVLITTIGIANNQSTLLAFDPVRTASQRQWLTRYLALPAGTREVDFSIIGPPPDYNVFYDNCAICLPQLRLLPATNRR